MNKNLVNNNGYEWYEDVDNLEDLIECVSDDLNEWWNGCGIDYDFLNDYYWFLLGL